MKPNPHDPPGKAAGVAESLIPYVVPLIAVLGLTVPPLVVLPLTSARHKKEMAAAPAPVDGITADSLTPTELGHLCGGAQHAAETALADLYLRGQLRRESEESSLFALTEAGSGSPVGDPVRDDIAHALRTQGSWNLDDLIDIGQDGAGMDTLRTGFADKGLLVDTAAMQRAIATRNGIHALVIIGVVGGAGLVTAAVLLGVNADVFVPWHLGVGVAGVVAMLLGGAGFAISVATGGRLLPDLTPTGEEIFREATEAHGATEPWDAGEHVSLDRALRRTAVTGIAQLAGLASRTTPSEHRRRDGTVPAVVLGGGEIVGPDSDEEEFAFGFLYQFVEEFGSTDVGGGLGGDGGDGAGADGGGG